MKRGYFPEFLLLENTFIHIENRNGNNNVKYKQADTLKKTYCLLKNKEYKNNQKPNGLWFF